MVCWKILLTRVPDIAKIITTNQARLECLERQEGGATSTTAPVNKRNNSRSGIVRDGTTFFFFLLQPACFWWYLDVRSRHEYKTIGKAIGRANFDVISPARGSNSGGSSQ